MRRVKHSGLQIQIVLRTAFPPHLHQRGTPGKSPVCAARSRLAVMGKRVRRLVSAQVQVSRIAARPFVSGVSCISLEHWSRQCQIVPRMAFLLIRLATRFWLRSHRHPASGSVRGSIYCVRLESLGMRPGAQPGPECTPSRASSSGMLRQRTAGRLGDPGGRGADVSCRPLEGPQAAAARASAARRGRGCVPRRLNALNMLNLLPCKIRG